MPAYEYKKVAGSDRNNVIIQPAQLATSSNKGTPKQHTNKYGRVDGVTAVNILTGAVTYTTLQGSGYGFAAPHTGTITDKEVDAQNDPYRTAARVTILGGINPSSSNYRTLG